MTRENETKRVFGDNPVTRLRQGSGGQARMNTFEKLTSLKQPKRQNEPSRILTTPEEIVRDHREIMRRMAPGEREGAVIFGRPSGVKFKSNFIRWGDFLVGIACVAALLACLGYVAIIFIVPFLRMLIVG